MPIIIFCIKTTSRDRDRDREAYALFLSFMSVIHVNHNLLWGLLEGTFEWAALVGRVLHG
jgi:hypothetical protein